MLENKLDQITQLLLTGSEVNIELGFTIAKSLGLMHKLHDFFEDSIKMIFGQGLIEASIEVVIKSILSRRVLLLDLKPFEKFPQLELEHFPNLASLSIYGHSSFSDVIDLDLTALPRLQFLKILDVQVNSIAPHENLNDLILNYAGIKSIDLSIFPSLTEFSCAYNPITEINLSSALNLKCLSCNNAAIAQLDLSNVPKLEKLICEDTNITELDLSNVPLLKHISCENTKVNQLDLSKVPLLYYLDCEHCDIKELNLESCPNLEQVYCNENVEILNSNASKITISRIL